MKKRIISLLLAVMMVVSLLPVTASAATTITASGGTNLQDIIKNASSGDTIKLTGDYTNGTPASNNNYIMIQGKSLTIDLNGHTIDAESKGQRVIYVSGNSTGKLTIKDSVGGGKITGGAANDSGGGAIYLDKGATLTMYGGSITGNTSNGNGGGIYINYEAKAQIYGGEVCNNKTLTSGKDAPIALASKSGETTGTLSLGGTVKIYGNKKSNGDLRNLGAGGTVSIVNSGTYTLQEGAEIWLNSGSFVNDQQITGTVAGYLTSTNYQYFFADPDFSVIYKNSKFYAHKHNNWTYSASGATLTAKCYTCSYTVPLTVSAPANANYDGTTNRANASLDSAAVEKWNRIVKKTGGVSAPSITYTNSAGQSVSQAINGGTYYANIKAGSTTAKAAFTVNRIAPTAAKLSYTAPESLIYDGNDHAPTFAAASGVTGLGNISVDHYVLNGETVTSAVLPGEYTVYAKVDDTGCNYTAANGLTSSSWKFTIVKNTSPVTINAVGEDFTYGDANKTGFKDLSVTDHEDFDLDSLVKTYYKETETAGEYESTGSTTVPTDVGEYKVVISVPDTDIHYEGSTSVTFSIAPKALAESDVEAISDVAYTGGELKPSVVVKDGEKTLAENTDYTVAYTNNTEIGTATATMTLCGNYTGTINKSFNITKATPTITTTPTASAITYGETLANSNLTGGAGSVEGTFAWATSTIAPAVSDSETTEYEVTFTPTDTAHYNTVICKVKVKVNKADYTGVANTASGNLNAKSGSTVEITLPTIPTGASYGTAVKTTEADKYTLSAISDGKITATSTGITAGGDMTFTVPVTPDDNHIGYTITVTITPKFHTHSFTYAADGNQIIATCGNTETDCDLDDSKIILTLSAEDGIYDGNAYSGASHDDGDVGFASTTGATVGNIEYYKGTDKLDAAPTDAGNYTAKITVTYGESQTVTAEKAFEINKASPTVDQFDYTAPESANLTYDGNGKTATVTFKDTSGKLSGMGNITVKYQKSGESTWSTDAPKNAGTYMVAIDVAEGNNYASVSDLTTGGWTFTITKATPTANDFGYTAPENLIYDGQSKSAAFAANEGVIGMGEIAVKYQKSGESTWSDTAPVDVGTYKVKIDVAEGDNYVTASGLTANDWEFTITKATPTASDFSFAAPTNRTYNKEGKQAKVEFNTNDGKLTGMGSITVFYQKDGEDTWSETAPTAVGTYKVAISVAEGSNYAATSSVLTADDWTFAITKAAQTITADTEQSFVYGDTGKSVIAALTTGDGALSYSVKSGDSVTVDASSGALTINKIGDTVVTVTAAETDNYNSASKDITVKIGAKAIAKPTAVDKTYTYTGEPQTFELTDFYADTMTVSGNTQTAANESGYTVTVTPKSNYVWGTGGDCTFTWVIGKASVTVPEENTENFTYTGEDQNYFILTGNELYAVASGEGLSAATQKDAGTYTIKLGLKDANNYKWASGTGDPTYTFTIAKAVYNGTKAASGDLKAKSGSTVTIDLPTLPADASYAATASGFSYGTATVANDKLTLTVGENDIPANTDAFDVTVSVTGAKNYENYIVTATVAPVFHTHSFTYSASGAVLTAICADTDSQCDLTNKKVTLTLTKNATENYYVYDSSAKTVDFADGEAAAWKAAVGSDAPNITYTAKEGSELTEGKAVNAGSYTASATVDTNKTATLDFTIAKATPTVTTAPTASAITYGQTLADSTLSNGTGSVAGTFAWTTSTTVPAVSDSKTTEYEVTFTPTDTTNYDTTTCKTRVEVKKADYADTYSRESSGNLKAKLNEVVEITLPAISSGASYGTVTNNNTSLFTVGTISNGKLTVTSAKNWDKTQDGTDARTFTVAVTPDGNHNGYDITVSITPTYKTVVTVTAEVDGFTYGETGKIGYKNASVTDHNDLVSSLEKTYYLSDGTTKTTADNSGAASEGAAPVNAGSYKVVLSVPTSDAGYEGSSDPIAFSIAKKQVDVIWGDTALIYDPAVLKTPSATYQLLECDGGGTPDLTVESDALDKSAGTFTASARFNPHDLYLNNYELVESTTTKEYTISPKTVTPAITLTPASKEYTGDPITFTSAEIELRDGSTVIPAAEYTVSYQNNVNAGTAILIITDKEDGNYAVSGQTTFTITKAAQKAPTAPAVSGSTVTIAAADREKKLEYSLDSENAWVSVPTLDGNGAFNLSGLTIGSHTIYLRVKESGNYNASDSVSTSFTLTQYSVAYNANGGVGSIASQTANSGSSVTVKSGSGFSRTGYTFTGWNTKADGSGTAYAAGASINNGATLYARWAPNTYTIRFNANGGSGTMTNQSFTYDAAQALKKKPNDFIKDGYNFVGWATSANGLVLYADEQSVMNLAGSGTVTLYAIWAQNVYSIKVNIASPQSGDVQIKLQQGNAVYAVQNNVGMSANDNKYIGYYEFTGVPAGTYNIVVEQNVDGKDVTMTQLVVLAADETANVALPESGVNSVLEVKEDTLPTVVGGLDEEAETNRQTGKDITVIMTVEKQEEQQLAATATAKDKATQDAISEIKATANGRALDFMNIEIEKTTVETGKDDVIEAITETSSVLELVFSYEMNGKKNIQIYRQHGDAVQTFEKLPEKPAESYTDGTFYVDTANSLIYVYAMKFSTYAIGYEEESSGGGSGGGGSSYAVTVESAKNGTVSTDKKTASAGSTVTITVTPDKGFTLETLTVLDKNGKEIEVKDLGNGKYSFKMPSGKVSISATFMEDNSMLNFFVDVKATDYYYDAVLWAAENGITKGTDAVHFSPYVPVTRAQVVTFLWRTAGCPEPKGDASKFVDVPANEYYAKAVAWAIEQVITKGTSETTFSPDVVCTRAHIVTFLARFAGVADEATGYKHGFTDVKSTDYFNNAVAWAKDNKVTEGTSATTFSPNDDCTRAQVVTFLYRWMVK